MKMRLLGFLQIVQYETHTIFQKSTSDYILRRIKKHCNSDFMLRAVLSLIVGTPGFRYCNWRRYCVWLSKWLAHFEIFGFCLIYLFATNDISKPGPFGVLISGVHVVGVLRQGRQACKVTSGLFQMLSILQGRSQRIEQCCRCRFGYHD